jgi:hypothetical protein
LVILEAPTQIISYIIGVVSQAFLEHFGSGLARLRNKARALFDSVRGLADCIDHECVRTDAQFLSSRGGTLFQFIRKF